MARLRAGLTVMALGLGLGLSSPASAGDYNGNFMVRLEAAGVITQDNLNSLRSVSGGSVTDLKAAGFDAEVSDQLVPALTLTYFLTRNLAVELFCCFSRHSVDLRAPLVLAPLSGEVAESWIFPPALTLQYHFDGLGRFKPYVGVGAQWIHFFNEGTGSNKLGAESVDFDDAFGVTAQAGIDVAIGDGWYLNVDVKKSWLDTTAKWRNSLATDGDVVAKVDLDPLIVSAGIGLRFNLEDVFGRRTVAQPLK